MSDWATGTWLCAGWYLLEAIGLWIVFCLLPALRFLGLR
jgi:hypothetical protein